MIFKLYYLASYIILLSNLNKSVIELLLNNLLFKDKIIDL